MIVSGPRTVERIAVRNKIAIAIVPSHLIDRARVRTEDVDTSLGTSRYLWWIAIRRMAVTSISLRDRLRPYAVLNMAWTEPTSWMIKKKPAPTNMITTMFAARPNWYKWLCSSLILLVWQLNHNEYREPIHQNAAQTCRLINSWDARLDSDVCPTKLNDRTLMQVPIR